jgi:dienelactone hydrolase
VLHGASGRPSDYSRFGFPQLLTDAVQRGVEPFVLAGADGGSQSWLPVGADNPQEMLVYEVPDWLEERGFDSHRLVGWGWSMGGYGVVRLGEDQPGVVGAIAAFSPTVTAVDSVSTDMIGAGYLGTRTAPLSGTPIGIWCGTADPLYPAVQDLVKALPEPLAAGSYQAGAEHTRTYWNSITPAAFDFLGGQLARMAPPPPG